MKERDIWVGKRVLINKDITTIEGDVVPKGTGVVVVSKGNSIFTVMSINGYKVFRVNLSDIDSLKPISK